jgi:hypothetical protein
LERSNRVNKTYTAQHAMSEGHPYQWLSSDLESARHLANTITRPWGHQGPTAQEAWEARSPLTPQQRVELFEELNRQRDVAAAELGIDRSLPLNHVDRSRLDRHALSTVLERLGYLTFQRGLRITKKPHRVTTQVVDKRARQFSGDSKAPPASVVVDLPPLLGAPPCVTHARRREIERSRSTPCAPPDCGSVPTLSRCASVNDVTTRQRAPVAITADESRTPVESHRATKKSTLAEPSQAGTMQADRQDRIATAPIYKQLVPAQRERAFTSWWRSSVTPLVSLLKTLKIMR